MRRLTKLLAGAALTMSAAPAFAADVPTVVPPAPPLVVVPPPAPLSPFAGLYAGVVGGWLPTDYVSVSGQAGFNFVRGRLLLGVEGQIGVLFASGSLLVDGEATARAGVLLGSRALVYAEAGALFIPANATPVFGLVGGGAEFALNDRISVFAEAKKFIGNPAVEFQAGINFHFGR